MGEDLWLVMEYVDGGTLTSVLIRVFIEERMIAAIIKEVRDPAWAGWDRGDFVFRALFQCILHFPVTKFKIKGLLSEAPVSAAAFLMLCYYTFLSCSLFKFI